MHLFSQRDQNAPVPIYDASGVAHFANAAGVSNARMNPVFGSLNDALADGNSWYNSLQLGVNRRFSRSVQAQLSYTRSRCLDTNSGTTGLEVGGGPQSNPYNIAADKGVCGFDVPNTLRINSVVALPFHGNKFVEGWQLSGILSVTSGRPLNLTLGGVDRAGLANSSIVSSQRPILLPGRTFDNIMVGAVSQWYDPSAFALPAVGTLGNLGRNVLRNPGTVNTDFAVVKDTRLPRISEQFAVQFRAEFFNAFNHTNFGAPGSTPLTATGAINVATAGVITSAATARQIQFGLKLLF